MGNAKTSPRKSVATSPRRNVLTSRRECVTLFRGKSAQMFQELNALKLPQDNVAPSLDKNVEMFLISSVAKCPRLTARCSTENTVRRFQPKTVVQEASVSVAWFQAFRPRRSMSSSVQTLQIGSVSQSPGRSATTWWSRCPSRPTSRSARLNTLKSAPSLVDTETDLVLLSM